MAAATAQCSSVFNLDKLDRATWYPPAKEKAMSQQQGGGGAFGGTAPRERDRDSRGAVDGSPLWQGNPTTPAQIR